ncbi:MAG: DUF177 domain-containing protein [Myxococcales bacterium]|nr:DUF177 domain-containing protein [Myxococcales bacterium]
MRAPAIANPYHVAIRELPLTRRLDVAQAFVAAAVAGMPLREALGDDHGSVVDGGEVEVELTFDDNTVFVRGSVRGTIAIACSRCVTPVAVTFDERVQVTYVPAADLAPADGAAIDDDDDEDGVELASDELDVYPYEGDIVDLTPLVREQFVLAVPYAPLCREDCQGLCPQCGTDKNLAPCSCIRPADPRFAALAGVKLPS